MGKKEKSWGHQGFSFSFFPTMLSPFWILRDPRDYKRDRKKIAKWTGSCHTFQADLKETWMVKFCIMAFHAALLDLPAL